MDSRTLSLLEFPKVLQALGGFAASEPGRLACSSLAPLQEADDVSRAAALFRQARDWKAARQQSLGDFPALDGLFAFLEREHGILDLDDLSALKHVLRVSRDARETLDDELAGERWPLLVEHQLRPWPAKTWSMLRRCISDEGGLKENSSPELLSARQEIRRIHQQCTRKAKDFLKQNDLGAFLQDDFVTISSDRYVLPLRTNFKGRLPGIIHDYSQTGETCYFEPLFLVDLNNRLQELKQEEREAERQVLLDITQMVRQEREEVLGIYAALVELDVLLAKAAFASALDARPLEYAQGMPVKLLDARHPLLALAAGKQGHHSAQPLDIELMPGQQGLVISGGNAGGKTVALKTLGLIAAMAASGLPVPVAGGSSLPGWRSIFVFLGDEQSLEDSVSTFTAQIRKLAAMWQAVGPDSLCILDEFGAGTDPSQGAALAQAVIDGLLEKGAHVAAATHFPALKAYALAREDIRAASVLFDPKTRRPLFRLAFDQVGLSLALDVAREHGLPEEVLRKAENYMLLDGSDTASLIEKLNELAAARDKELKMLADERNKLAEKRSRLEERYERERKAALDDLKARSQKVLRDWQEQKLSHKQAMRELAKAREQLAAEVRESEPQAPPLTLDELEPGMKVRYLPWKKNARIEELDPRKQMAKVDLSGVSMWAALKDLQRLEAPAPTAAQQGGVSTAGVRPSGMRLDLRGLRADEAVSELAGFLDRALLGNVGEVEVIHGKGTGALRREVHRFLADFPAVENYSLGNEEQGGDGMTLVELK